MSRGAQVGGSVAARASVALDDATSVSSWACGLAVGDSFVFDDVSTHKAQCPARRRFDFVAKAKADRADLSSADRAMPNLPAGDWAFLEEDAEAVVKVALVGSGTRPTSVQASFWCAHVDGILHWPLVGRLLGGLHDLRGGDAAMTSRCGQGEVHKDSSPCLEVRADFATYDVEAALPFEWDRDRGCVALGWARARGTVDARPRLADPTLDCYAEAERFLEGRLVPGEERSGDLALSDCGFVAECESSGFYVVERAPGDYDSHVDGSLAGPCFSTVADLKPTLEPLAGCKLSVGVSRMADATLRCGVRVEIRAGTG